MPVPRKYRPAIRPVQDFPDGFLKSNQETGDDIRGATQEFVAALVFPLSVDGAVSDIAPSSRIILFRLSLPEIDLVQNSTGAMIATGATRETGATCESGATRSPRILRRALHSCLLFAAFMLLPITVSAQPFTYRVTESNLPELSYGSIAVGDFDQNGFPDVLLAGNDRQGEPYAPSGGVALSNYSGIPASLTDLPFLVTAHSTPTWLADISTADVDGDGDLDYVLSGARAPEPPYQPVTRLFVNDGSGAYSERDPGFAGIYSGSVTWSDADNDGDSDLLISGMSADETPITVLYWNDGDGSFSAGSVDLPSLAYGSNDWADYDLDGDYDVIMSGMNPSGQFVTRLYRNDGDGVFVVAESFPGRLFSSQAWGDFDSDGDLDLIISGAVLSLEETVTGRTDLYRNVDGSFVSVSDTKIDQLFYGNLSWGDFDLDGDLDLFVVGRLDLDGTHTSRMYRNTPTGFQTALSLVGVSTSENAWVDFDRDGDLDILVSGLSFTARPFSRIYENVSRLDNSRPLPPDGLTATKDGSSVLLGWNPGSDEHTATVSLSYNLQVGMAPGSSDVMDAEADALGNRYLSGPGNVGLNTGWKLRDLKDGTYYWRVQSVDNSYVGSNFSDEEIFVISGGGKVSTDSDPGTLLPERFTVYPGFPNPVRSIVTMPYDLPESGHVRVVVFDALGRAIARLKNSWESAGRHSLHWDGRSATGTAPVSGVYLVRFEFGRTVVSEKITILR